MEYTVIGDTVNFAQRLQAFANDNDLPVVISESVYEKVKSNIVVRKFDNVVVKGKSQPVTVYVVDAWYIKD